MYKDGFTQVVGVDISPTAIKLMQERTKEECPDAVCN